MSLISDAQREQLKRQLEAAPWLKWAGLLIAALLAVLVIQQLDEWRQARHHAARQAQMNLQRILALNGQDVWLERETAAVQLRDALRAQLPEATTAGAAQAALQNWLRTLTADADERRSNLSIQIKQFGVVEALPGVLRVNAVLSGAFSPQQALDILRRVESTPNLVAVETLTILSQNNSNLHLSLNAYYRLGEEASL